MADGERDDDGHEHAGDPVGEPLHRRLARLGVLDEPGDLGERGVGADPGRADDEAAAGVDGRAGDRRRRGRPRPGTDSPVSSSGVDRRGALLDDAVGGDLLAGADDEAVADRELGDRNAPLASRRRAATTSLAPSSSSARRAAPARRLARASK